MYVFFIRIIKNICVNKNLDILLYALNSAYKVEICGKEPVFFLSLGLNAVIMNQVKLKTLHISRVHLIMYFTTACCKLS